MSIQRKYSKTKAVANHVVWTEKEILQVPFKLEGLVFDKAEGGLFRAVGRDIICAGYRVSFQYPASSRFVNVTIDLQTGDGTVISGTTLKLNGVNGGGEKNFSPGLVMPVNSTWKFRVLVSGETAEQFYPQGLTFTYLLRYSNGPAVVNSYANVFNQSGIGFQQVGRDLVVN